MVFFARNIRRLGIWLEAWLENKKACSCAGFIIPSKHGSYLFVDEMAAVMILTGKRGSFVGSGTYRWITLSE